MFRGLSWGQALPYIHKNVILFSLHARICIYVYIYINRRPDPECTSNVCYPKKEPFFVVEPNSLLPSTRESKFKCGSKGSYWGLGFMV